MLVIKNRNPIPCDVDETLIFHVKPSHAVFETLITIEDPLVAGQYIRVWPNDPMIKVLKDEKLRGSHITVWSRSGWEWAEAVVKALGIEAFVDIVQDKPRVYLDDKPVQEWLADRVYLKPDRVYKKHVTTNKGDNNGL
jgi:hypothetical protein